MRSNLKSQECTFYFNTQKKIIDKQELPKDYKFFYSISQFFQNFVRIKGKNKYKPHEILSEEDTDIYLEKSLPLIQYNNYIYIFSNKYELEDFYRSQNLYIKSIKFMGKEININNLSILEDIKHCFDFFLEVDAVKIKITNKYVINDRVITIEMVEGISEEEQLEIIKKKYFNNKKFIHLEFRNVNKIIAKINIQGETKIESSVNILDNEITMKDFLQNLRFKYNDKDLSIDCDKEKIKDKLIDIDFDEKSESISI